MSELTNWIEKTIGEDTTIRVLSPADTIFANYLKEFWIRLASRNPDQISDPLFLRTSVDFELGLTCSILELK